MSNGKKRPSAWQLITSEFIKDITPKKKKKKKKKPKVQTVTGGMKKVLTSTHKKAGKIK